jgi:segregation and condensation protein B
MSKRAGRSIPCRTSSGIRSHDGGIHLRLPHSAWRRWWRLGRRAQFGERLLSGFQQTESSAADPALCRLEAVLFAAPQPLSSRRLAEFATLADGTQARTLIRRLNDLYDGEGSALRVEEVAGGFQLLTRARFDRWVRKLHGLVETRPRETLRLSQPALETLTIIAYRQPVLRAELEAVRGVQCGEILKQLLERELVRIVGRSSELGRPFQYGTTRRFLQAFGLKSLEELPRPRAVNETKFVDQRNLDQRNLDQRNLDQRNLDQHSALSGPSAECQEEPTVNTVMLDPSKVEQLSELWGDLPEVGEPLPVEWLPDLPAALRHAPSSAPQAVRAAGDDEDEDLEDDDLDADLDDDEDEDDDEDDDDDDWDDEDDEGIEDVDWEDDEDLDEDDDEDDDDDDWDDEDEDEIEDEKA